MNTIEQIQERHKEQKAPLLNIIEVLQEQVEAHEKAKLVLNQTLAYMRGDLANMEKYHTAELRDWKIGETDAGLSEVLPAERDPEMEALGFEITSGFFGYRIFGPDGVNSRCFDTPQEAWAVVRRYVRMKGRVPMEGRS